MDGADGAEEHAFAALLEILEDHPAGLSEYDLFRALAQRGDAKFSRSAFANHFSLFQSHFILFNMLYRLRDRLLGEGRYDLRIDCLQVMLLPYEPSSATLPAEIDKLRAYYLDLDQLRQTTAQDVQDMLDKFWRRFGAMDERGEALRVLELEEPVDYITIKRQYHRLALTHHPDRGGDGDKLRAINAAMSVLTRYYLGVSS